MLLGVFFFSRCKSETCKNAMLEVGSSEKGVVVVAGNSTAPPGGVWNASATHLAVQRGISRVLSTMSLGKDSSWCYKSACLQQQASLLARRLHFSEMRQTIAPSRCNNQSSEDKHSWKKQFSMKHCGVIENSIWRNHDLHVIHQMNEAKMPILLLWYTHFETQECWWHWIIIIMR